MKTRDDYFKYFENNKNVNIGGALAFDAGNLKSFYLVYAVGNYLELTQIRIYL